MSKDKAIILGLSGDQCFLADMLSQLASDGYELTGATPLFGSVLGVIYSLRRGDCIDRAVFKVGKREPGSLSRCWDIDLRGDRTMINERLQAYIDFENSQGYRLAEIIPLAAFPPGEPGADSVGVTCVFERKGTRGTPLSLDKWAMKETRDNTKAFVPCPVLGCRQVLPRMTSQGPNLGSAKDQIAAYLCPEHRVFVSPSTFEYEARFQSILWRSPDDEEALRVVEGVLGGKRTWSRMGRENDEDSLTWNVFYCLQKNKLLRDFAEKLVRTRLFSEWGQVEKAVFWSVDIEGNQVWPELIKARKMLGESATHGSEPDLLLVTRDSVILVEIKFNAPVKTSANQLPTYYTDAAKKLNAFTVSADSAIDHIGYEMARFFLLGKALEAITGKSFSYVTITKSSKDVGISAEVSKVVNGPQFVHLTWKQVRDFLSVVSVTDGRPEAERRILLRYLDGKTAGYDGQQLQCLLDAPGKGPIVLPVHNA